jgi:hypothetical protein
VSTIDRMKKVLLGWNKSLQYVWVCVTTRILLVCNVVIISSEVWWTNPRVEWLFWALFGDDKWTLLFRCENFSFINSMRNQVAFKSTLGLDHYKVSLKECDNFKPQVEREVEFFWNHQ